MYKGFFAASVDFIDKHILDIILVALIFFVIFIYTVLNHITYPKHHPVLEKVVILEK